MTSILDTQQRVNQLQKEARLIEAFLEQKKARLAEAIAKHRAQIAKSLTSKDPAERAMAESIREWWEVPFGK